ncbi:MAG TPA: bifunctional riboflavin kinase/FAD synthetase [Longimicrobiales bacterium]|nr:bifunctional riboflavin kinase/FAD synthetase [Longimicrobiales bacterium]
MTPLHLPGAPLPPRSAVVTVGTFDGVHRGHRAVLDALLDTARRRGRQSVVVTFDPHPLYVVRPQTAPRLLTTTAELLELLHASAVNLVAIVPFNAELAAFPPRRFVEQVLLAHFGLEHLVIGYDHGFGKDRSGDVTTLQEIGRELDFGVTVVPHTDLDDQPISSTRIRRLLQGGEVRQAAAALGRAYSLCGTVVRGDGRGRALGFPTANLHIAEPEKLLPADGIYAVRATIQGESAPRDAVLHLGERPTFESAAASVEVFILDFEGDLYGKTIRVEFCTRVRDVERFDSLEALVEAMDGDVSDARRALASSRAGCA